MSNTAPDTTGPGCAWTAGLILGAIAGIGLLTAGVIGVGFGVVGIGLIAWKGPRQIALGGYLAGLGGVVAYLFGGVLLRCAGENADVPGSCDGGDIWPWVIGSVVTLAVGIGLSVVAARRAR